jgi:hypothetical protein
MSVKSNKEIVTDGLVHLYDAGNTLSYTGSGSTWTDLKSGYSSALTNGPTYNSANGGVLDFDGTNDYALVNDGWVGGKSEFTIEAWVKLDQTSSPMNIIYHEWYPSDNGVLLRVQNNLIQFYIRNSADTANIGGNFDSFTDTSSYNHIVATYDGSTVRVYVNGVANTMTYSYSGTVNTTTTNTGYVGYYGNPVAYYLNGKMSSLKLYDKGLTAAEISQNYNALKNRFV